MGGLKIPVSEFYSGNALPSTDYTMSLEVDGNSWTRTLDANDLTRTLTGVDVSATPHSPPRTAKAQRTDV